MKLSIYILIIFLFSNCHNENKYDKYDVRIIDIKVNDNAKDALNFLSKNMDPLLRIEDEDKLELIEKDFFYFNLTSKKK